MAKPHTQALCPLCERPAAPAHWPFCSRRCADVDLGRWLTGRYVVPGPPAELDDDPSSSEDHPA